MAKIELPITRDLGQTIGDPFLFVRQNFKVMLLSFTYFVMPALLVYSVLSAMTVTNIFTRALNGQSPFTGGDVGLIIAEYLFLIIASFMQQLFVFEYLVLYEKNKETTIQDIWEGIKRDWPRFLASVAFLVLMIIAVAVSIGFMIAALTSLGEYLVGLFVFIVIVAAMYAIIPMMNILPITVREKINFIAAVAKSFKIAYGSWWRTFIGMLIVTFILYMLVLLLLLPLSFIGVTATLHSIKNPMAASSSILGPMARIYLAFVSFGTFIIMTTLQVFVGINYYSLSEKYDHFRLKEEIARIGERQVTELRNQEGEY